MGDGEDNMDNNLHDEIAALAYELFENKGRVGGSDIDNWLEAERIVRTLRKIAGEDGKKNILINVPATGYFAEWKTRKQFLGQTR